MKKHQLPDSYTERVTHCPIMCSPSFNFEGLTGAEKNETKISCLEIAAKDKSRAGVYKTLSQHMLAPNTNLANISLFL